MSNSINTSAVAIARSFVIAVARVQSAQEALAAFNTKIAKLALPLPAMKWSVSPAYEQQVDNFTFLVQRITVENLPSHLGLSGWELVATLEHHASGNVVFTRTAIELPDQYRATDATLCEHCHTKRNRSKTIIVRHALTNEFKQVGSSCLKDFLGHDVSGLLAAMEQLFARLESATALDRSAYDATRREFISTKEALAWGLAAIEYQKRYVSAQYARPESSNLREHATPHLVRELLEMEPHERFISISESHLQEAEVAIDWRLSQPANDQYSYNLRVICESGYTTYKNFNIAISLLAGYTRERDARQQAQRKAEAIANRAKESASQHLGVVGERLAMRGIIQKIISWESPITYNHTAYYNMHIIKDNAGNVFKVTTSTGTVFGDEGETICLVGTVKEHAQYNGVNQTVLTRAKKTETLEGLTPKPKSPRGRKPKAQTAS